MDKHTAADVTGLPAKGKKPAKPGPSYHFFGSHAWNWCVGNTREEVLARLASKAGADAIKANVKAHGGLYVWTCRVESNDSYEIESYAPVGVPISNAREYALLSTKTWAEKVPDSIPLDQCTVNQSRWSKE